MRTSGGRERNGMVIAIVRMELGKEDKGAIWMNAIAWLTKGWRREWEDEVTHVACALGAGMV